MKKYFVGMIVLALAVIPIAGCVGDDLPVPNNLEDVVITLERTACFGTCPVYKLTVYGNGTVIYNGEEFVTTKGQVELYQPFYLTALMSGYLSGSVLQ